MDNTPQEQEEVKKQAPDKPKMSVLQKIRVGFSALLLAALVIFVAQNSNKVEVEFLSLNFRIRIVFIILVSALLGSLITFLLMKQKAKKKRNK